ncbi:hypothetical protein BH20CHL3_BH20CHL3_07840 [soil metagenome]
MALDAARSNNLPGGFDSWSSEGVFATLATGPELRFLSTIVAAEVPSLANLVSVLGDPRWDEVAPGIVFYEEPDNSVDKLLQSAGFTVRELKPAWVRTLLPKNEHSATPTSSAMLRVEAVVDEDIDEFMAVLLAGYQVTRPVARFIEAEHREHDVRRFAVRENGRTIAVAGMTLHGTTAVLGGATTLPTERGKGAQSALLRRRLEIARQAGCVRAIATAAAESPSSRNLERSGFQVFNRPSWCQAD